MAKKKVTAKKPRATQAHELTAKGQSALSNDELGPQAKLVASTLKTKGTATAAQIASAIGNRLKTEQPVIRVVAYYLGQFKREGLTKVAKSKVTSIAA